MRKVIVSTNVTLDGRVDNVRDWALPYDDDEFAKYHTDLLRNSDGLLLGRKTYEMFAAVWPSRSGESPVAGPINGMAKYVASTTHSLLEHDLIDEYQLLVYPVVLGKGRSLFKDGVERMALELVDSTVVPPGVAILTYQSQL